jgi:hypothetical protein
LSFGVFVVFGLDITTVGLKSGFWIVVVYQSENTTDGTGEEINNAGEEFWSSHRKPQQSLMTRMRKPKPTEQSQAKIINSLNSEL